MVTCEKNQLLLLGYLICEKNKSNQIKRTTITHENVPGLDVTKIVKHLDQHLQGPHHMEKNEKYYQLLEEAKASKSVHTNQQASNHTTEIQESRNGPKQLDHGDNSDDEEWSDDDWSEYEEEESSEDEEYKIDEENSFDAENTDGKVTKCSNEVENILAKFHHYLTGPERGRKEGSVTEVVKDVRRIMLLICVNKFEVLFEDGLDTLQSRYIDEYCQKNKTKAGSIKKYLMSLIDFCQFLIYSNGKTNILNIESLKRAEYQMTQWRKKYKGKVRLDKHLRNKDDYEMLVDKNQIAKYRSGKEHEKALKILQQLKTAGKAIGCSEYCCVRDHLFIKIALDTGHRSGVLANMTMEEFKNAIYITDEIDGDRMQIDVKDHKTNENYGPAPVMLRLEDFEKLECFVRKVRTQLRRRKDDNIFLSWRGNSMKSGYYSRRLHTAWKRSGNFENRAIPTALTINHIRKSISTGVRKQNRESVKEVARAMMHDKTTADEHYDIVNQQEAALQGTKEISDMFENFVHNLRRRHILTPTKSNSEETIPRTPRKQWTEKEVTRIKSLSPNHRTLEDIKAANRQLQINASPKQIYDKIRHMTSPKKALDRSGRVKWNEQDLKALRTQGNELIDGGSLAADRIAEVLQDTNLRNKFSIVQLRTRINHERNCK